MQVVCVIETNILSMQLISFQVCFQCLTPYLRVLMCRLRGRSKCSLTFVNLVGRILNPKVLCDCMGVGLDICFKLLLFLFNCFLTKSNTKVKLPILSHGRLYVEFITLRVWKGDCGQKTSLSSWFCSLPAIRLEQHVTISLSTGFPISPKGLEIYRICLIGQ